MRLLLAAGVGPVAGATINATALGIFEAVIVLLLARAGATRSRLKKRCETTARIVNQMRGNGFFLSGERWEEYALDTEDRFKDMRLRLGEVLDPELIEARDAELIAMQERSRNEAEASRRWQYLADKRFEVFSKVVAERNKAFETLAQKFGQEYAERMRDKGLFGQPTEPPAELDQEQTERIQRVKDEILTSQWTEPPTALFFERLATEHGQDYAEHIKEGYKERSIFPLLAGEEAAPLGYKEPAGDEAPAPLGHIERSDFPPPAGEEARGVILLKIIAAVFAQWPFSKAIRQDGDLIGPQEPPGHMTLSTLSAVREWLSACERVGRVAFELRNHQATVTELVDAADRSYYGSSPPTKSNPAGYGLLFSVQGSWKALYPSAMNAFKVLESLSRELKSELSAWESNRPSTVHRVSLTCGLIGGWATFVVGVIVPLTVTNPPRLLYLYLPLAFYFLVLSSVMIFGIRETQQY